MRITIILVLAACAGAAFGSGIAAWSYYSYPDRNVLEDGLTVAGTDPSHNDPMVEVDNPDFDFGSMDSHTTATHDFIFRNVGGAPLELEAGRTTCKCTLSEIGDDVILPGESGKVTLEWSGKDGAGPYSQTATIITNDPRKPTVELRIHGEMTARVQVVPNSLVFSSVTAGQPANGSVRVYGYLDDPLQITDHEIDDPEGIEVSFSSIPQKDLDEEKYATSGYQVDVALKPGLPLGPFRKKIHLDTNLEDHGKLVIPVEGVVSSDISIFGPGWSSESGVLRLGRLDRTGASRKLLLKVGGHHPEKVEFEIAEVRPDFVQVRLEDQSEPIGSGAAVTPLEIEIPAGSPPCNYFGPKREKLGLIRLETTHPTVKELNIYVRFLISG